MAVLADRYRAAVLAGFDSDTVDWDLLPTVLTVACLDVLGVDGAGLSLIGTLRVPLAASSEPVRRAEQLQVTLGMGPCLTAVATAEPLVANSKEMAEQWPVFYQELTCWTPFRSVAALPLALPGRWPFAALDLYLESPDPDVSLIEDEVSQELAAVIAAFLTSAPFVEGARPSESVVSWLATRPVESRMNVWTAIGMVMASGSLSQSDGLARLRAYAYSHDTTVDHVADQLTRHHLPPSHLTG